MEKFSVRKNWFLCFNTCFTYNIWLFVVWNS